MEEMDPLVGKSLEDVFQNPKLAEDVLQLTVLGAYEHEGTFALLPGEIAELTRQYKEARGMPVEKVYDRKEMKLLVFRRHPFINVSDSILYNADRYIIQDVQREAGRLTSYIPTPPKPLP